MTTDRELLELAAKAAGIEGEYFEFETWPDGIGCAIYNGEGDEVGWNPLTSDGDALRLAVKLEIQAGYSSFTGNAYVRWNRGETTDAVYGPEDPYAATRRAIVRAAAELGRATNAGS